MAQQVEHVLGKDEVTGSNPVSSSIQSRHFPFENVGFCVAQIKCFLIMLDFVAH